MPTPTEQALVTLVPSINALPQELISLANALLVQSKAKAPNLKSEEEIGRIYACANIACERSKTRLGLEKLQPRPPVPPRIYKKLYTFLDRVLSTPATPKTQRQIGALANDDRPSPRSGRSRKDDTPRSGAAVPKTPSKTPAPANAKVEVLADTPSRRSEKRARAPSAKAVEVSTTGDSRSVGKRRKTVEYDMVEVQTTAGGIEIPSFVPEMSNRLCTKFRIPGASARILAGVKAVLDLRGFTTGAAAATTKVKGKKAGLDEGPLTRTRIPALMIILTIYLANRLAGEQINEDDYRIQRKMGVDAVQGMEEGRIVNEGELIDDVEVFLRAAAAEKWLEMPWFSDIDDEAAMEEDGQNLEVEVEDGEVDMLDADDGTEHQPEPKRGRPSKTPLRRKEKHAARPAASTTYNKVANDDEDTPAGLKPGLGTMFQDALDWLSEDRREDYRIWEQDIRAQIEALEKQGAGSIKGKGKVRGMVKEIEKRAVSAAH